MMSLEQSGQETRTTGFLSGFDGVYAGRNAQTQRGSLLDLAVSW